jgi:hypothetical protein
MEGTVKAHQDFLDWLWGKSGKRDEQIDEARRAGRSKAIADRVGRQIDEERKVDSRRSNLRDQIAKGAPGSPVFDPESGKFAARDVAATELEHLDEVSRRAAQAVSRLQQSIVELAAQAPTRGGPLGSAGLFGPNGAPADSPPGVTGPGLLNFGFGVKGTKNTAVPLPPDRPDRPAPVEIAPKVDTVELDGMSERAQAAAAEMRKAFEAPITPQIDTGPLYDAMGNVVSLGGKLQEIDGMTVSPTVNAASIESGHSAARAFLATLQQIGATITSNAASAGRMAAAVANAGGGARTGVVKSAMSGQFADTAIG